MRRRDDPWFQGQIRANHPRGAANPERFPSDLGGIARRKLVQLDSAISLSDLAVPPGNRLEALKGDLRGRYSIRINDQWRIVFRWTEAGPDDVEIVDYH